MCEYYMYHSAFNHTRRDRRGRMVVGFTTTYAKKKWSDKMKNKNITLLEQFQNRTNRKKNIDIPITLHT